jgi:uncharacterized membrane protein
VKVSRKSRPWWTTDEAIKFSLALALLGVLVFLLVDHYVEGIPSAIRIPVLVVGSLLWLVNTFFRFRELHQRDQDRESSSSLGYQLRFGGSAPISDKDTVDKSRDPSDVSPT